MKSGCDLTPEVDKEGLVKTLPPPSGGIWELQLYSANHTEDGGKVNMWAVFWKLHSYFHLSGCETLFSSYYYRKKQNWYLRIQTHAWTHARLLQANTIRCLNCVIAESFLSLPVHPFCKCPSQGDSLFPPHMMPSYFSFVPMSPLFIAVINNLAFIAASLLLNSVFSRQFSDIHRSKNRWKMWIDAQI